MTVMASGEGRETDGYDEALKSTRRKRVRTAAVIAAATLVADVLVLKWVVPWAAQEAASETMSMGYVVTFLVVFLNFMIVLGIAAYVLHQESYPSDRWT